MKTKLNLTINSKLVPNSKEYARKKGKSVSQLVEELLEKELDKMVYMLYGLTDSEIDLVENG